MLSEIRSDICAETFVETLPLIDDNVDSDIEVFVEVDQEVMRLLSLLYKLVEMAKLSPKPDKLVLVEKTELSSPLVE